MQYLGRLILSMVTMAGAGSLSGQVADVSTSDEFKQTLSALERYRVLASEDDSEILPPTKKPVEQGGHYAGIPRLIRLLTLVGDLASVADPADPDVYDATLVAAVKRFQARHGLESDGRLGKGTLAQLNTPLSYRVRQLELALERWRRLPYDPSRRAIVLNLPEFKLRAFDAGHRPALEMKIVIGQAHKLETPLFASEVDTVLFRPYWNVPFSIQRKELLPHIQRDPSYISKNDFELVTSKGAVVSQDAVADTLLAQLRSGTLRLRQRRGPKNSLGLIKFVFPNKYDVYMHDTPAKSLFSRARRDFSHGCIRLEKAQNLAEWVLRDESGWRQDRIVAAMQGTESVSVRLKKTIPVTTMYVTAVVTENGEVHFFEDIYGKDAALERELAEAVPEAQATSGEPGPRPRE
jgi:L,D-transpeptidase YcbB